MSEYVKREKIGEGTYGVVYKGYEKSSGRLVAIKRIRLGCRDGVPGAALREVSLLRELSHPNIVWLQDVLLQGAHLYLIFEYLSMDLRRHLDTIPKEEFLDHLTVKRYLQQILKGVVFCHSRRILHRDLKPQNLLIDDLGSIKLADFGLARAFGVPTQVYTHEVVTLWYRAPEVLLGAARYSTPVDVWSVGAIFAEMVTKMPLFHGDSEIDQLFHIFRILGSPTPDVWPGLELLPAFKPSFPHWPMSNLSGHVPSLSKHGIDLLMVSSQQSHGR
uniref:Cyclin dependent kinase 1 n=1 Tax=Eptatretus burgeri TaxID=7764 RepID=A0A8C4PX73_EPTBU